MDNFKETNKYSRWMLTVGEVQDTYFPTPANMVSILKNISGKWHFQEELATSRHYQCCFETTIRKRKSTLLNMIAKEGFEISQFTLDPMRGSWEQAVEYCSKDETAAGRTFSSEKKYSGTDIDLLDNSENRFPWQQDIIEELLDEGEVSFKTPNDRTIIWIKDPEGCSGKSKLVKWFAVNFNDVCKISFGSATQIRSALITVGPKTCYFIDIPRTLGQDESEDAVLSAIEDLKNGFLVAVMYGKYQSLIMDPPHIVVFSNSACPIKKMSTDRWKTFLIHNKRFMRYNEHPVINTQPGQSDPPLDKNSCPAL